jgi:hypothetical protein
MKKALRIAILSGFGLMGTVQLLRRVQLGVQLSARTSNLALLAACAAVIVLGGCAQVHDQITGTA